MEWLHRLRQSTVTKAKGHEVLLKVCPFCSNNHWNIQVNKSLAMFNCWVCGEGGHVGKLLTTLGIDWDRSEIQAKPLIRTEEPKEFKLPTNKALWCDVSLSGQRAKEYLQQRGMTEYMIYEWHVKLCSGMLGDFNYDGYYMVPLFGVGGLEYYIAGRYMNGKGYKLPDIGKDRYVPKTRGSDTIVLVEGLFDAVSIWRHTQYDVLMLMGKHLLEYQTQQLLRSAYTRVIVCLDGDAYKDTTNLAWRLYRAGAHAYTVKLPIDKDPGDLGEAMIHYLNTAEEFKQTSKVMNTVARLKEKGLRW